MLNSAVRRGPHGHPDGPDAVLNGAHVAPNSATVKASFGQLCAETVEMIKQGKTMDTSFLLKTHLMLPHQFGNDDATVT